MVVLGVLLRRAILPAAVLLGMVALSRGVDARSPRWVAAWSAPALGAAQLPLIATAPLAALGQATLRQTVPLAIDRRAGDAGADQRIRVRFSNEFAAPGHSLHIAAASLARPANGSGADAARACDIEPATLRRLRFDGHRSITIAAGRSRWSDPIRVPFAASGAADRLAVSFYLDSPTAPATLHSAGRGNTRRVAGNAVGRARWAGAAELPWGHVVTGIDLWTPQSVSVLATFGDSLTEGTAASPNAAVARYPEILAARLESETAATIGQDARTKTHPAAATVVLNLGISGNRLLADGVGPSGLDRFARDVLSQSGIGKTGQVVILIGINDIGFGALPGEAAPSVQQLAAGLQQLIDQAQADKVGVLLGTLPPFKGSPYDTEENEALRAGLNAWMRSVDRPVTLVDFDRVLRDPAQPLALAPPYDGGDHLHPSAAGYAAMAAAVEAARESARPR
ncbi:MAG: GDSL-type esterase/lipase family protein [Variovorax sp.]